LELQGLSSAVKLYASSSRISLAGFGGSSVLHTDKLLRMSQDLPMVLEVIESNEKIEKILPRIDEMVDGGLVTLEKVRVLLHRATKK